MLAFSVVYLESFDLDLFVYRLLYCLLFFCLLIAFRDGQVARKGVFGGMALHGHGHMHTVPYFCFIKRLISITHEFDYKSIDWSHLQLFGLPYVSDILWTASVQTGWPVVL